MRKYLSILLVLCLLCLCAAGCGGNVSPEEPGVSLSQANDTKGSADVIDLTKMSSTLVYAEVYNITNSPEDYIGKTIKMRGVYSSDYDTYIEQQYHVVLIEDAAACCSQGMEFIWNGEHAYPEEYPENGAEIEVAGEFGTYEAMGQTYYCVRTDELTVLT